FLSINPEEALRKTIGRFQKRFSYVEDALHRQGRQMCDATPEEMDALWEQVKTEEKESKKEGAI
ncbi:MAG: nucleoside triphosphate pyrophosphohydrolase, partial [Deltaproteobacteria bacterium]|nr:nucleoside triphosphate pyrophosphohydrolase [Deltaproteobacteria bacterium]